MRSISLIPSTQFPRSFHAIAEIQNGRHLVTLTNSESLKEICKMACVTPAWSSRGQTYRSSFWRTISYFSFRALWFANDTARPPSSVYTVISGNPRSHAEYLVDSVNPVSKQVPRNCRNSKWSSLTWYLAHPLVPSSQINSSGYHSIKGRTRLDGVELEKYGDEHGIKWGRTR